MTTEPTSGARLARVAGQTLKSTDGLLAAARDALPAMTEVRRRLHRHPEIGLRLPQTQAAIAADLRTLGLPPISGRAVSSVTSIVGQAAEAPTVLLRADMDALPLTEETGLEFASEVPGTMHACGHDMHVAMLLGAARILLARREQLAGRVLLMFQPGEEGFHGARAMLEEGLLEAAGEPPVAAFAIHVGTRYPTGTIHVRPGPIYASSDVLRITVLGRGGHASAPHMAVDPIAVAAEIVLALQTMVTRRVDAFDPAVVTIAHLEAGTTNNVIPPSALLEGTIRTVSERSREAVHGFVRRVVDGVAAAHGATADVRIERGYPVTVNDPEAAALLADVARQVLGNGAVEILDSPIMGAEDFSYVLQRVPGAMAFLGARLPSEAPETAPQNHSNLVVFDEAAMVQGAAVLAALALQVIGR